MSEQEFGELLVSAPGAEQLVYLKDVATIRRGYADPPPTIMRFNGKPAIALGISTVSGGNVVVMGEVDRREAPSRSRPRPPWGWSSTRSRCSRRR